MNVRMLLLVVGLIPLILGMSTPAAILHLEEFDADIGVVNREGIMAVAHDGGNDWMTGSFSAQGFAFPQTDAFVINVGNFTGSYAGLTQIRFQMFAVNVLPSDMFIRIIDGVNIFSYQFNPIAGMYNNWQTFTVDLAWSYGWSGISEAAFNTALNNVDQIEVQLSRSGGGAQAYRLDNFETLDTPLGGGGGPSAVPEPNTISLIFLIAAFMISIRRTLVKRTA
jgi:hypothetical protein